jgi:hypothetical protein
MDESLHQKQDKDFLLRLCLYTNIIIGNKNKVVAFYRHHSSNTTSNLKEKYDYQFRLFSKWKKMLNQAPISFRGKIKFIYQYTISKNKAISWPIIRKIFIYPFIIIIELFQNLPLFIPTSHKAPSSH